MNERVLNDRLRHELPGLTRSVRNRIGPGLALRVDAEDILQDSFASLLKDGAELPFPDDRSLHRRIAGIATNRVLDAARKNRTRGEVALSTAELANGSEADPTAAHAELARVRARLREALSQLTPAQRLLVILRDWVGASWDTVALVVGGSKHAAQCRYARARRALVGKLRSDGAVR